MPRCLQWLNKLTLFLTRGSSVYCPRNFPVVNQSGNRLEASKKVMERAGITGPCATSKGLRHGFGIAMIEAGVPITPVRDLLSHADLKTTEIYLSAVGQEKKGIVMTAWEKGKKYLCIMLCMCILKT